MRSTTLIRRSLIFYWRTNLAVIAGVAIAVSVLSGALLVGDSVRGSLRDLVLRRLGNTDQVIGASTFFREQLAEPFSGACPLIALEGLVTHQPSGRRASGVLVYGIDERFWRFHGVTKAGPGNRQGFMSEALAQELGARQDEGILLRIEKPSAIPAESLHGRKENVAAIVRFSFAGALSAGELGEFAVQPQQGSIRAVFVSLRRLQTELGQQQRANTLLLPSGVTAAREKLKAAVGLEDLGLSLKPPFQLVSNAALLDPAIEAAARSAAADQRLQVRGVLTYLANTIRCGAREVPYSLVTATDIEGLAPAPSTGGASPIVLNDWTARELRARPGDSVELDYYVWREDGRLGTASAKFQLASVIPLEGAAADRGLAPDFPGITDSEDIDDWDPPFAIDLARVRKPDEDYWRRYRATPKAFLRLEDGQALWRSRYGKLTSLRFAPPEALAPFQRSLMQRIDPLQSGFFILPAREQGLSASRGATDFGEYFVYFSFFLVVSALLMAALFFRLGIEHRIREIGTLEATGFSPAQIRRIFTLEGVILASAGSLAGMALSLGFAAVILHGLRTWWVAAVGTRLLTLHVSPASILIGGAAGILAAAGSVIWTLFSIRKVSPRERLAGVIAPEPGRVASSRLALSLAVLCAAAAFVLLFVSATGRISQVAGFFGAGTLLLVSFLSLLRVLALGRPRRVISAVAHLGFRSISYRPGRTVLCTALIASATFIVVAVDAFRITGSQDAYGYQLVAESVLPIYHNPSTREGAEQLNLRAVDNIEFVSFRLRPGDDVSCLNLYQPRNPRVLGVPASFIKSVATADGAWRLLEDSTAGNVVPAIVAANSLTYVLHRKVGDELVLPGTSVRFRIAGVLADTVFQRELIISEQNFQRLFPDTEGYRVFLLKAPAERLSDVTAQTEEALADYGFDAVLARDRLAEFHRVENTYLSTFQTLGALGLLLGTVGLAVVLLRNVLERRRELALLRAVGYRSSHLARIVLAENILVLVLGLGFGTIASLVAILPAFTARGGHLSLASLVLLLAPTFAAGLTASLLATIAVVRLPLLASLRSE